MNSTDLLLWGLVAHIVADWFLQNDWMAQNKTDLTHPAAWVHSAIHMVALWIVFPMHVAYLLGVAHLVIDTRVPLQKWRRFYGQTSDTNNPVFVSFAMWQDQAAHILCLAVAALLVA